MMSINDCEAEAALLNFSNASSLSERSKVQASSPSLKQEENIPPWSHSFTSEPDQTEKVVPLSSVGVTVVASTNSTVQDQVIVKV